MEPTNWSTSNQFVTFNSLVKQSINYTNYIGKKLKKLHKHKIKLKVLTCRFWTYEKYSIQCCRYWIMWTDISISIHVLSGIFLSPCSRHHYLYLSRILRLCVNFLQYVSNMVQVDVPLRSHISRLSLYLHIVQHIWVDAE